MLGGCGTTTSRSAPCHDSWTGGGPGERSSVYRMTVAERETLDAFLPQDGRLICAHSMPLGALILIWTDGRWTRTMELTPTGEGYVVTKEEVVV